MSLEELVIRHAIGQSVDELQREQQAAGVMMIPVPKAGILGEVRGKKRRHIASTELWRSTSQSLLVERSSHYQKGHDTSVSSLLALNHQRQWKRHCVKRIDSWNL